MSDYIMDLRKIVGSRPLLAPGACVIFIDNQQRILMVHRTDNDLWGFPGGSMNLAESFEDTARREVLEEVGLICNSLRLMSVYSGPELYGIYPNGDEVYNIAAAYLCSNFSGILTIDPNEVKEACFFDLQNIPQQVCSTDRIILDDLCRTIFIASESA